MVRKRASASAGGSHPLAANARATSVAAPSPTMRPIAASDCVAQPHVASSALADSARSRRESTSVPSRSKTMKLITRFQDLTVPHPQILRSSHFILQIFSVRSRRFPDLDAHHRQALAGGVLEDQARDPFDGRVALEQVDRLAELLERLDQRIVLAQDHLVIELAVDPAFHDPLDVAEVADHVARVEAARAHLDLGHRVVAVRMLADAVVVEEAVAVAELDALRN